MSETPSVRTRSLAPTSGLLILTGAADVGSFFAHWAQVVYPVEGPRVVTEAVGHQRIALLVGLFTVVAGVVSLTIGSRDTRRAWASIGAAGGVIVGAFAVFDLLTERSRAIDRLVHGIPVTKGLLGQVGVGASNLVVFSFRPGIYLALAGAVIALGVLVMLLLGSRLGRTAVTDVDTR